MDNVAAKALVDGGVEVVECSLCSEGEILDIGVLGREDRSQKAGLCIFDDVVVGVVAHGADQMGWPVVRQCEVDGLLLPAFGVVGADAVGIGRGKQQIGRALAHHVVEGMVDMAAGFVLAALIDGDGRVFKMARPLDGEGVGLDVVKDLVLQEDDLYELATLAEHAADLVRVGTVVMEGVGVGHGDIRVIRVIRVD